MDDFQEGDAYAEDLDLTEFGQWLSLLCRLLGTNPTKVGRRASVGRATITDLSHPKADGRAVRPEPETIRKLWESLQQFSIERSGHPFSDDYREGFWNAGDHVSPFQHDQSSKRLSELHLIVALLAEKDQHIAELRRENNALRKRQRHSK